MCESNQIIFANVKTNINSNECVFNLLRVCPICTNATCSKGIRMLHATKLPAKLGTETEIDSGSFAKGAEIQKSPLSRSLQTYGPFDVLLIITVSHTYFFFCFRTIRFE